MNDFVIDSRRLFGNSVAERRQGDRRSPASSPASVTAVRGTPVSGGSQQQQQQQSQQSQQQQQQTNAGNPPTSPIAQPLSLQELTVRTITMTRDPPDSHHGFGICVKGGKDAGEIRSTFRLPPSPYFVPRERGTFYPKSGLNSLFSLVSRHCLQIFKSSQASRLFIQAVAYVECCCYGSEVRVVWSSRRGSTGRLTVKKSDRRFRSGLSHVPLGTSWCFARKSIRSKV